MLDINLLQTSQCLFSLFLFWYLRAVRGERNELELLPKELRAVAFRKILGNKQTGDCSWLRNLVLGSGFLGVPPGIGN